MTSGSQDPVLTQFNRAVRWRASWVVRFVWLLACGQQTKLERAGFDLPHEVVNGLSMMWPFKAMIDGIRPVAGSLDGLKAHLLPLARMFLHDLAARSDDEDEASRRAKMVWLEMASKCKTQSPAERLVNMVLSPMGEAVAERSVALLPDRGDRQTSPTSPVSAYRNELARGRYLLKEALLRSLCQVLVVTDLGRAGLAEVAQITGFAPIFDDPPDPPQNE